MTDPAETHFPTAINKEKFLISKEKRTELIAQKMREILDILGLDPSDPSLAETPHHVAKMYVEEVFSGLDPANFPSIDLIPQKTHDRQMVLVKNIPLTSFCEHHFVPMIGKAHVAYLPKDHIIGLSKVNRLVHYFSKRPQLQERLTAQIADSLSLVLNTEDVAIYTSCSHHCVMSRGVQDIGTQTDMHVLRGLFQDSPYRTEFFSSIQQ